MDAGACSGASYKDVTSRADPVAEGDNAEGYRAARDFVSPVARGVQGEEAMCPPPARSCERQSAICGLAHERTAQQD